MKTRNSLRVSPFLWMHEDRVRDLLAMLAQHPEIDEVAFFTSLTHLPLPLAEIRVRAEKLAQLMPRFREIGVSAGINHLSTMGHMEENVAASLNEPWQRLIDQDGTASPGCYCVSDERMENYVRDVYRALALAQPEFIWLDDDIRLSHHQPVNHACFCDLCLARFGAKTSRSWTRESLVAAFNEGTRDEKIAIRSAWLQHIRDYISDVIRCTREAVDESAPQMPLGFMSISMPYNGNGYLDWARALENEQNAAAKIRPGGGFYRDDRPLGFIDKAHEVGRQIAPLPPHITDVQYEHENFPYQPLSKSKTIFVSEIAAAIGAGCTGAALNVMSVAPDPFDEFLPYFQSVQAAMPFFQRAVETFGRSACEGVYPCETLNRLAVCRLDENWFAPGSDASPGQFNELSYSGLPFAYGAEKAAVTLLTENIAMSLAREELLQILAGGVALDGSALECLHSMDLGHLTGFEIGSTLIADAVEVFTDDALNDRFAGWTRDCRPTMFPCTTYLLNPAPGARVLSTLTNFQEENLGAASGVYQNELGGRVCVLGYYPWHMTQTLAKTSQLKNIMRWLSRETLPAFIASFSKAALWCRRDAAGHPAYLLINASFDTQTIALHARADEAPETLSILRIDGSESRAQGTRADDAYRSFTIPDVAPWQAILLCAQ